jgi:sialate O-acetylesterase
MKTAQTVPNTGIATAVDIGDAADIHPKNKQEVGRRLALNALARTYGQQIESSGPVFRGIKIETGKIRLFFDHAAGLAFKSDKPQGFAIAGEDRKFVWAEAKIEDGAVVVSSPQVPSPVTVRYAWADNPVANLVNGAGLPAMPFRIGANFVR